MGSTTLYGQASSVQDAQYGTIIVVVQAPYTYVELCRSFNQPHTGAYTPPKLSLSFESLKDAEDSQAHVPL